MRQYPDRAVLHVNTRIATLMQHQSPDPHVQVFFEESPERLALLRAGHDIELQEPETAVKSDQPKSGGSAGGGGGGGYLGWFSSVHIPYVASVPPPDPDERFARLGQRVTAMHGAYQALAAKCGAQLTREHVRHASLCACVGILSGLC